MVLKNFHKDFFGKDKDVGAAALEYVLVTMFGLVFSLGAIAFVSETLGQKFSTLEDTLGVEFETSSLNPFADDGS